MRLNTFIFAIIFSLSLTSFILPEQISMINVVQAGSKSISKDDAARIAAQQTNGQVLGVETKKVDGQTTHFVKVLLSSGHIKVIPVSAKNGAVRKE